MLTLGDAIPVSLFMVTPSIAHKHTHTHTQRSSRRHVKCRTPTPCLKLHPVASSATTDARLDPLFTTMADQMKAAVGFHAKQTERRHALRFGRPADNVPARTVYKLPAPIALHPSPVLIVSPPVATATTASTANTATADRPPRRRSRRIQQRRERQAGH